MSPVHADHEVFTISGRVAGGGGGDKGTFVVAASANEVTTAFASWGFEITSMASLADVRQSLEILEALAARDPRISADEFLDLLPAAGVAPRPPGQVFAFVGQTEQGRARDTLQAGFANAPDREFLTDYLKTMGFDAYSVMSCIEARELQSHMQRIACDQDDDASHLVNFKAM